MSSQIKPVSQRRWFEGGQNCKVIELRYENREKGCAMPDRNHHLYKDFLHDSCAVLSLHAPE
eukprot:560644-Hanusia_phi.AAC.3